ncbi:hypothetical protein CRG98_047163 [Punica granatum]|uniref:Uncharacterized protein n=1 Tax=Punica granatum TaxID=22663 RepID=A0A2I0HMC9_PUNGR|nr:hypothetical protein CRG98_047163 [Punica granatum]
MEVTGKSEEEEGKAADGYGHEVAKEAATKREHEEGEDERCHRWPGSVARMWLGEQPIHPICATFLVFAHILAIVSVDIGLAASLES